jgi:GNAT superfamily N-acetyltransferase
MPRISADRTSTSSATYAVAPATSSGTCRALTEVERPALVALFRGLDHASRYQQFGHTMTDAAAAAYGAQLNSASTRVIGRFDGATLVGIAEISVNDASQAPCAVALIVVANWQHRGVGTALLQAAVSTVHASQYTRLIASFQSSDHRMRDLVENLRSAPRCWTGEEELIFRIVVATCSAPLPVVVANGGDVSVAIEWSRPNASQPHPCPA